MSEPCEFEFVPRKRAVRDSVAQIGNRTSKSEASIQSETALDAGETENSSMDQLEARHQREHKDVRFFRYQGRRLQYRRRKRIAQNTGKMPIIASVLQCCSNCEIGMTMDPTLHYKMKADEAYDGSGERLQPRYVHRDPMQARRHLHRNKNRQLSKLIVKIETDAQTE